MINFWGLLALLVDMVIERTHINTEDVPSKYGDITILRIFRQLSGNQQPCTAT
jgi:hypothetical protein